MELNTSDSKLRRKIAGKLLATFLFAIGFAIGWQHRDTSWNRELYQAVDAIAAEHGGAFIPEFGGVISASPLPEPSELELKMYEAMQKRELGD